MYSASDVVNATVSCNLLLHVMAPPANVNTNAVVDLLVLRIAGKVRVTIGFHSSAALPKQNASLQGACYVAQHSLCCCPVLHAGPCHVSGQNSHGLWYVWPCAN